MTKTMSKMLLYVSLFLGIVFGIYAVKKIIFFWFVTHYSPPSVTISAVNANPKKWQSFITAVGSLRAVNGVDLSAEIPGVIEDIRFNSGQFIHEGEVILTMRTLVEKASLKSAEAKLQLAKLNYEREKSLFTKKVSSQSN